MGLHRLVYHSRNKLDVAQGGLSERVSEILAVAVAKNRTVDISGGLIFNRGWFMQVLEGDRLALAETYARIERDPRHIDITTIEFKPVAERRFSFWWMAAAGWSADNAALFQRHCGADQFDPRIMNGESACNLIAAVLDHQMRANDVGTASRWLSGWRDAGTAHKQAPPLDTSAA